MMGYREGGVLSKCRASTRPSGRRYGFDVLGVLLPSTGPRYGGAEDVVGSLMGCVAAVATSTVIVMDRESCSACGRELDSE